MIKDILYIKDTFTRCLEQLKANSSGSLRTALAKAMLVSWRSPQRIASGVPSLRERRGMSSKNLRCCFSAVFSDVYSI